MRYQPGHKAEIHQKIVRDASRRVRSNGLNGAAVAAVMGDTGLTHGGFYKHFGSKDDLLVEFLSEGFREIEDTLVEAAQQSPPGEGEEGDCENLLRRNTASFPTNGSPLATLGPELARVDKRMKPKIVAELVNYKCRMLPFMPGRRTAERVHASLRFFQR